MGTREFDSGKMRTLSSDCFSFLGELAKSGREEEMVLVVLTRGVKAKKSSDLRNRSPKQNK